MPMKGLIDYALKKRNDLHVFVCMAAVIWLLKDDEGAKMWAGANTERMSIY